MTSTGCVCAGSEIVPPFYGMGKSYRTPVRPSTSGQHLGKVPGAVYEAMPEIGSYNLEIVTKIDTKLFKDYFMSVMTD